MKYEKVAREDHTVWGPPNMDTPNDVHPRIKVFHPGSIQGGKSRLDIGYETTRIHDPEEAEAYAEALKEAAAHMRKLNEGSQKGDALLERASQLKRWKPKGDYFDPDVSGDELFHKGYTIQVASDTKRDRHKGLVFENPEDSGSVYSTKEHNNEDDAEAGARAWVEKHPHPTWKEKGDAVSKRAAKLREYAAKPASDSDDPGLEEGYKLVGGKNALTGYTGSLPDGTHLARVVSSSYDTSDLPKRLRDDPIFTRKPRIKEYHTSIHPSLEEAQKKVKEVIFGPTGRP